MPRSGSGAPATTRRRTPRPVVRTVTSVAVVSAVVVGGSYAAGLGPFARGATEPEPAALAQAHAFLADWAAGRLPDAAGRTTSPTTAQHVLRNFTAGLDIRRPTLTVAATPTQADDDTVDVPFTATMPIADLGTWTYRSKLPLRQQGDGSWKVDWSLSVVHPRLNGVKKFHLEREAPGTTPDVTDRKGASLSGARFPSLSPVLNQLGTGTGGGAPRGAIQLVDRATGKVERTEATFGKKPGRPARRPVRTTLDATWQAAAEKALATGAHGRNASLVALRIDNGEILAMANSPSSGFNRAVSGTYAPGSTWKIVTSSALLLKGAVAPADVVDCPKYLTVGKEFHNVETSEHRNATFLKDFTESCNTAFISLRGKLGNRELGDVAGKYFGVGQKWHVGIASYDGSVPEPRDETEKAASMIGQGRIQANPLIMASVTATAVSGTFHQPSITHGNQDSTTTTPLPRKVVTQLRAMLRTTVTDGTARVLSGLPGEIGAKTGTAEISDEEPNNGWLAAYRGNVAVACIVEQGVTGGGSAGPVIRDLLTAVPTDPS
ncbi:penicillin-binding transpeptidase domain-containing protein [Streptomyces endophytica]|uniref:Penicillin-binding transpeptidase domain-containing protein n=1 Tax=Streptomyces endophytica TaxID=2991496 RepID=A0ABY6PH52_9ACTN|nr:penicillin-binding transpeptidase domain-containing protein [Streptomyces endophytica]UZJ32765.1 penicillin-binding transpeptidase domain-containing protein [Streptomyces endophytica]